MNSEYLNFIIPQIKKSIESNSDKIYIGYLDFSENALEFEISRNSWIKFLEILKEYAIEEENYEYCNEIINLQNQITILLNDIVE